MLPDHKRSVWIDSGCSKTIFCNEKKLINVCKPEKQYTVNGLGGNVPVLAQGDFQVSLRATNCTTHVRLIKGCLVAPNACANLLATKDLAEVGIGFAISPGDGTATLTMTGQNEEQLTFALERTNKLIRLPFYQDAITHICGVASHHFKSLTQGELWHLRLGHASARKIATLSKVAKGFALPLAESDIPCHFCQEAKATRSTAPPQNAEE